MDIYCQTCYTSVSIFVSKEYNLTYILSKLSKRLNYNLRSNNNTYIKLFKFILFSIENKLNFTPSKYICSKCFNTNSANNHFDKYKGLFIIKTFLDFVIQANIIPTFKSFINQFPEYHHITNIIIEVYKSIHKPNHFHNYETYSNIILNN
jgi:hypothetical protein